MLQDFYTSHLAEAVDAHREQGCRNCGNALSELGKSAIITFATFSCILDFWIPQVSCGQGCEGVQLHPTDTDCFPGTSKEHWDIIRLQPGHSALWFDNSLLQNFVFQRTSRGSFPSFQALSDSVLRHLDWAGYGNLPENNQFRKHLGAAHSRYACLHVMAGSPDMLGVATVGESRWPNRFLEQCGAC